MTDQILDKWLDRDVTIADTEDLQYADTEIGSIHTRAKRKRNKYHPRHYTPQKFEEEIEEKFEEYNEMYSKAAEARKQIREELDKRKNEFGIDVYNKGSRIFNKNERMIIHYNYDPETEQEEILMNPSKAASNRVEADVKIRDSDTLIIDFAHYDVVVEAEIEEIEHR